MTASKETGTIEQIKEFKKISDYMNDPQLDEALELVVKIILEPDLPPHAAVKAVTQLSALAAKFGLSATLYKNWEKGNVEERYKKDMYYTARDALNNLVDALKYQAKNYQGHTF